MKADYCFNNLTTKFVRLCLVLHETSPNHLRLALVSILNARMDNFMALFAVVCSSYVTVSAGTHKRTPWNALGDESVDFVLAGNHLASVTFGFSFSSYFKPTNWIFFVGHHVTRLATFYELSIAISYQS